MSKEPKSNIDASEKSRIEASEKSQIGTSGKSLVDASTKSGTEASMRSHEAPPGKFQIDASEKSGIEASGKSQIDASEMSRIVALGRSQVDASEKSRIDTLGRSQIEASGHRSVGVADDHSRKSPELSPELPRLPRAFYERPAELVARELLGCVLSHRDDNLVRRARIVETEAYIGPEDLACHASKGRTPRTEVMFGEGGHAYVYLIYGLHHLFNVVTGAPGHPAAVLVRACVPIENCEGHLSGPGALSRALSIDMSHYGEDLLGDRLWIEPREGRAPKVVSGPRIGVDYAGAWAKKPLRFAVDQEREVSRPRPFRLRRT